MQHFLADLALMIGGSVIGLTLLITAILMVAWARGMLLRLFRPFVWRQHETERQNWERFRREEALLKSAPPFWLIRLLERIFACDFDRAKYFLDAIPQDETPYMPAAQDYRGALEDFRRKHA